MSCHMIHFAIAQCMRLSKFWQNAGTSVASLDVYKAFDVMQQSAIAQLLAARGWRFQAITLVLAHMAGMTATPELDGAKPVQAFNYDRGVGKEARKQQ